jgi:hypothetical protein
MEKAPIALATVDGIHCRMPNQSGHAVLTYETTWWQNMSRRSKGSETAHLSFWNWRFHNAASRSRP